MRAIVLGCCLIAANAAAQSPSLLIDTPTYTWLSFGGAIGTASGETVSGIDGELSHSVGSLSYALRASSLKPTAVVPVSSLGWTEDVKSASVLVGARRSNGFSLATLEIGPGMTQKRERTSQCDTCAVYRRTTQSYGAALEGGIHFFAALFGIGARMYAFVGPGSVSHTTFSLSVDFGRLGRFGR